MLTNAKPASQDADKVFMPEFCFAEQTTAVPVFTSVATLIHLEAIWKVVA